MPHDAQCQFRRQGQQHYSVTLRHMNLSVLQTLLLDYKLDFSLYKLVLGRVKTGIKVLKQTATSDVIEDILGSKCTTNTHPAVLVDRPEPFHCHVSDMAPPEQNLPWNKARKN